jgi:hypothetical protein
MFQGLVLAGPHVMKNNTMNNLLNSFVARVEGSNKKDHETLEFDHLISFFELYRTLMR